jgi:DNA invertase Pin-like site-specific DNA recombinase
VARQRRSRIEPRRRDISRKTKNGLDAARRRGRVGGRPTVVDDDKRRAIFARRAEGQRLRIIAKGTEVSLAVVHRVISEHEAQNYFDVPEIASESLPAN